MTSRVPFPGMDPYLEHPVLWPGVHSRLLVEIAKRLAAPLRPRYAVSVEERVFLELPGEPRAPDVWVQETGRSWSSPGGLSVAAEVEVATPVMVSRRPLEVREHYLEILDLYRDQRVVTTIELLSPTNKYAGPGRKSYRKKQKATLASRTHLVEIDLLRTGPWVIGVAEYAARRKIGPAEYVIGVSRADSQLASQLYPIRLRQRLPKFNIPVAAPDPDVVLDLQEAFEQTYEDGSYMQRVKYDEPCVPPLPADDQTWATERWNAWRAEHPEWFPPRPSPDV